MRKGAEIVSVELTVGQEKLIFSTIYRVGTLGEVNQSSIMNSLTSFYGGRAHKRVFVVGDFNLSSVEWPISDLHNNSANQLEKMFIDSF
jgi:hypothetical protein